MTSFTREQLERFGLRPDTSLGQHFLADDNVLDRILELARVVPGEHIVEPGPGLGPLTRRLAAAGARVTAIEYDERMREPLEHAAEGYPNIRVIYGDAVQQGAWTLEHV